MNNTNAKWIWNSTQPTADEYVLFVQKFNFKCGSATLNICAETEYVAYINGKLVSFGQFAGYPFEKYYDSIPVSEYCVDGENILEITARYEGVNSLTHIDDGAGLLFCVKSEEDELCCSGQNTLCCLDERYVQHKPRFITTQLGYTCNMKCGENKLFRNAVLTDRKILPKARPVKKLEYKGFAEATHIGNNIYDLGRETAGYLSLKVKCTQESEFKVAYGEHIEDGNVRYIIGKRDFSFDFEANEGEQSFIQYFVMVAGRYFEIFAPDTVEVVSIGLEQYMYPFEERSVEISGHLDRRIYDTCIRTLRLSTNYHYEDCPWREQALYVLDSKNQMLCGYYGFKDYDFQRANLVFMSKGKREDGLLELTYPAVNTPAIPFFSIMYPVLVLEYIEYTGDISILSEVMPTIKGIMDCFTKNIGSNNLISNFPLPYWNFFEWSEGNIGYLNKDDSENTHILINLAYVFAGRSWKKLCELAKSDDFNCCFDGVLEAVNKNFFNSNTGLFKTSLKGDEIYSQLINSFALLVGLGDDRTVRAVKECDGLVPATLSMLGYVYDALLEKDYENNKDFVLSDIREKYGYMLNKGATSFWETIDGAEAFSKAGSLCHGWSAMPVYYFHKLGVCKYSEEK